jgi:hypothetical protein
MEARAFRKRSGPPLSGQIVRDGPGRTGKTVGSLMRLRVNDQGRQAFQRRSRKGRYTLPSFIHPAHVGRSISKRSEVLAYHFAPCIPPMSFSLGVLT